jgi:diguanylate cyclase (GGDEF)-like protein
VHVQDPAPAWDPLDDPGDAPGQPARILVADDSALHRALAGDALRAWGHEVYFAEDGRAALETIRTEVPDLALVDWVMPGMDGLEVIRRVRAAWGDEGPALMMLTARDDGESVVTALDAGADDYLPKPFHPAQLRTRVDSVLRWRRERDGARSAHRLLEDERAQLASLHRVAHAVALGAGPEEVLTHIAREVAVLLAADSAGVTRVDDERRIARIVGRYTTRAGAGLESQAERPIDGPGATAEVYRTGLPARSVVRMPDGTARSSLAAPVMVGGRLWGTVGAVVLGADGFPGDAEARLARFAELAALGIGNAAAREELENRAATDALTGLWNRRTFDLRLPQEVARVERSGHTLVLAMLDIDHFKRINDVHGHSAGDVVLRRVADVLRGAVRAGDVIARVGGEEFAWIMPCTDLPGAGPAAERARLAVHAVEIGDAPVTVSIGLAALSCGEGPRGLVERADAALYAAKRGGRDRVHAAAGDAVTA